MADGVRVLIAEDDDLMRAGLKAVLSSDPAIEQVRALRPDVVLMDVRMPDVDGIAATRELTASAPETKVLMLTTFEQDDYIFGGLAAGAAGFLLKRTTPEELIGAIHTVAAGDSLLSPSVTRRVIAEMAHAPRRATRRDTRLATLTPREHDVLVLIGKGMSNAEIASELVVEESTVKSHVKRILQKLQVRDRVQAVIVAYESGVAGET